MNPVSLTPHKSLNKAYRKQTIYRDDFEKFRSEISKLLDAIQDDKDEEYNKNLIRDFLKSTFYGDRNVNTKERTDLAIYLGGSDNDNTGIILEAKRPPNKAEMVSPGNLNAKAMHEVIYYYFRERIENGNDDIRRVIITNAYEWFIFDAHQFEKHFYKSNELKEKYHKWKNNRKISANTDYFYNEIAKPFIDGLNADIEFTYFDVRKYRGLLKDGKDDKQLIHLYLIFSPPHLLKEPFTNDSNTLDRKFYQELLHIIGLEESKSGGKKVIKRKSEGNRNNGSLLENTIRILRTDDILRYIDEPENFGAGEEEQLFNIALELNITWINRILFLKLLEAQIVKYRQGDKAYKFLDTGIIKEYDDLYELFHEVLAKKVKNRNKDIIDKFKNVPYLNSSLFEISKLEHKTIRISSLKDRFNLPVLNTSVFKRGRQKAPAELPALEYLLNFLDAFDFSSENAEHVREENKSLINASVLGLIFEKINGYKEGSFFTPGFITMYMCRETVRRAVLQKFKEVKNWDCDSIQDLRDKIEPDKSARKEANAVINSIKVCDPAVGSGHFLVSALNEIIAVKSELGILSYTDNSRVKQYKVEIHNDELVITDVEDDEIFQYNLSKEGNPIPEKQGLQKALFHEKQTIIENCLFGVDINPNSVNICRLRLWIELLKNSYYTEESGYKELETLPNIDINIKQGNSLISRFDVDTDLKKVLKTIKYSIDDYKNFVKTYQNAATRVEKRNAERIIDEIKKNFREKISESDPRRKKLNDLSYKLHYTYQSDRLIDVEHSEKDKEKLKKQEEKLRSQIRKLNDELEKEEKGEIYRNAFEWRFEFPEVLDNNGNFLGFDVVIGNPPYIYNRDIPEMYRKYFKEVYEKADDLYTYFTFLSSRICRKNDFISLIMPNTFLTLNSREFFRKFILSKRIINIAYSGYAFVDAYVENLIIIYQNRTVINYKLKFILGMNEFSNTEPIYVDNSVFKNNFLSRFFYPTKINLNIYNKYIKYLKSQFKSFPKLLTGTHNKEESEKLTEFLKDINPGDIILLGLIADGDQGLVTGNNSKYLAKTVNTRDEEYQITKELYDKILNHRNVKINASEILENKETLYSIAEEIKIENNKMDIFGRFFLYKTCYENEVNEYGNLKSIEKRNGTKQNYPYWIKYHLGNHKGFRWVVPNYTCIDWSEKSVQELKEGEVTNSRWQGVNFFDSSGFAWVDYFTSKIKAFFVDIGPYSKSIVKLHSNSFVSDLFIVGLLNSKFISYYVSNLITLTHTLQINDGRLIPIIIPEKDIEDDIADKTSEIITLKKQDINKDTNQLESEIDCLVYDLYGLTEDEIGIVEESV